MDQEKIGKFITSVRKEKNLTQQALANKLGITDRAISKWENGRGMPDLSLIKPLCDELDISVNELLNGERLDKEKDGEQLSREALTLYSNYLKRKSRNKLIKFVIIILLAIFIFIIALALLFNKTFIYRVYNSNFLDNVNISIPRFSYYRSTGGMEIYTTKLKTLKQPDEVNIHIDRYLNTLEKFNCDNNIYYYNQKNDFTIIQYRINNDGIGFINTIYITYSNGKYCE